MLINRALESFLTTKFARSQNLVHGRIARNCKPNKQSSIGREFYSVQFAELCELERR